MKQYTFPYRRGHSSLIGEIHGPIATISIQAKNKKWINFTLGRTDIFDHFEVCYNNKQ